MSRYPFLIAELIRRGWSDKEIIGVAGGNSLPLFPSLNVLIMRGCRQLAEDTGKDGESGEGDEGC